MSELEIIKRPTIDSATAVVLAGPLDKTIEDSYSIAPGTTVDEWLADSGFNLKIPTLVLLNAEPLLEADWNTQLRAGDILTLVRQPGEIITVLTIIGYAIAAAATAYSIYLALTLDTGLDEQDEYGSQNTSISYRGNSLKPGAPRPVVFGLMRTFPDLVGNPYSVFEADGQGSVERLYLMMEVSDGKCTCTDHEFDGTALSSFSDWQLEVLLPGETSTIIPDIVYDQTAVNQIDLDSMDATTAFATCEEGTTVHRFSCNFNTPQGIYYVNSIGNYEWSEVHIYIQYRLAGSADAWTNRKVVFPNNYTPRSYTITVDVAEGRYEVRCVRTGEPGVAAGFYYGLSNVMEQVVWTDLYGYTADQDVTSTSTRIALTIRASNQLGRQALTRFSTLAQRWLRTWNGTSWSAPVVTNGASWAFCEVLRSSSLRGDEFIDLDQMLALSYTGSQFNGVFDSAGTERSALDEIAACCLGRAIELPGGVYTLVIDEQEDPTQLFTAASVVKNTFKLTHNFAGTSSFDSVDVSFFDKDQNYREAIVRCVPNDVVPTKTKKLKLRGATETIPAAIIGYRMVNENRHRRDLIEFETGTEGRLLQFGDTIAVQHYQLAILSDSDAVSGAITAFNGSTQITVEEDISAHASGWVYVGNNDGTMQGPLTCTVAGQVITITEAFDATQITFDDHLVDPIFTLGGLEDFIFSVKITSIEQASARTIKVSGFIDNPNAYINAETPESTLLPDQRTAPPKITNVSASVFGESDNPRVKLSWQWENADYARISQTLDGVNYETVARAYDQSIILVPPITSTLRYSILPVGALNGWPVETANIDTSAYKLTVPSITGLTQVGDFDFAATIGFDTVEPWHAIVVTVSWNGEVKRSAILPHSATSWSYSSADAIADDPDYFFGVPVIKQGARSLTFNVYVASRAWFTALDAAFISEPEIITLKKQQIGELQNVVYTERSSDIGITYSLPDTRSFAGVVVHLSQTHGFIPSSDTAIRLSNSNDITITGVLAPASVYYMRLAGVDSWGADELVYSDEVRLDTSDDVLSGEIPWGAVVGDGKPDDFATLTGYSSSVTDPRFDSAAAAGALTVPHWFTQGGGSVVYTLLGYDGGACAAITADGATDRYLFPGRVDAPIPTSQGMRFLIRARIKRSASMLGRFRSVEYDRSGNILTFVDAADFTSATFDTWSKIECVYTVSNALTRSVHIGIMVGAYVAAGQSVSIDDFNFWQLPPAIGEDNISDYLDDDAIDTPTLKGGAVTVTDVGDRAADVGYSTATPGAAGQWGAWNTVATWTVDFINRKDGQALILNYVNLNELQIEVIAPSAISLNYLQIQLVRDDDGTVLETFVDDEFFGSSFGIASGTTEKEYGGNYKFEPWETGALQAPHANGTRLTNAVDTNPPSGLIDYSIRFRMKNGTQLTSLKWQAGSGRLIASGGRA